jgi:hypothetical protein
MVFSHHLATTLYKDSQWDPDPRGDQLHDFQSHETGKYGLSPMGPRSENDCGGEGQQQFTLSDTELSRNIMEGPHTSHWGAWSSSEYMNM